MSDEHKDAINQVVEVKPQTAPVLSPVKEVDPARDQFAQAALAVFKRCISLDSRLEPAVEPLAQVLTEQFGSYLREQEVEWSPDHARTLAGSVGFNVDQLPASLIDADPQLWVNAINSGLASIRGLDGRNMDSRRLGSLVTAWGIGRFFMLNLDETQAAKSRAVQDALAIAEASELIPPDTRATIHDIMKISVDRAAMRVEDHADRARLTEPFNNILYQKPLPGAPDFSTVMHRPSSDHLRNMDRAQIAVQRLQQPKGGYV